MEKIEIIGASKKGNLFCSYKFRQAIGKDAYNKGKMDSERPIHEDLRNCFDALGIHLPVILGELPSTSIPDINSDITGQEITDETRELINLFTVSGVEIDLENGEACIVAAKSLEWGSMPFTTPMIKFEGSYPFAMEFRIMIDRLVEEVLLYIDGKQAPVYEQTDMFAPSGEGTEATTGIAPEKRKRGRPKKVSQPDAEDGLSDLEKANLGNDETEPLTTYFNPAAVVGAEEEL